MTKRMLQMLAAVALFLAVIGFVKYRQIQVAVAAGKSYQPPPDAVTTVVARTQPWASMLEAVGTVAAVQGVTLAADQPGVVSRIAFESGSHVRLGDVLVSLDTRQESAQLLAAMAQRDLAKATLDRTQKLLDQQVVSQSDYDQAAAQFKSADAAVLEIQASIDRKQIRAPFSGVVGIRQVNLGQYLHSGDAVVPLQSMDPIYINFSVPQQEVAALRQGAEVHVSADSLALHATGRITAVNSVVDESTRNVQVQASFENPHDALRPGMFVDVHVTLGSHAPVIALPTSAINYAPYGNSVFVVETKPGPGGRPTSTVHQQFVRLGPSRGDLVAIVSGVRPGQEVVTSGVFKLRNGASVMVNNQVQPGSSAAPKPEDS